VSGGGERRAYKIWVSLDYVASVDDFMPQYSFSRFAEIEFLSFYRSRRGMINTQAIECAQKHTLEGRGGRTSARTMSRIKLIDLIDQESCLS
jgi:hypothetical protein